TPAKKAVKKAAKKAAKKALAAPPKKATISTPAKGVTADHPSVRTVLAKPELLALTAVRRLGDEARTSTAWLRDTYPNATSDGLPRPATQRFVRRARNRGAAAGLTSPYALLPEAGGLAWLQARLVLHIAAAFGHDPTDPQRAAEILMLQRIHAT